LTSSGDLELTLAPTDVRPPGGNEVVVRVEAAPVNPSDLGLLLGAADLSTAKTVGEGPARRTTITVPPAGLRAMAARVGTAMPVCNEGAGVFVAAGEEAKAVVAKTLALVCGGMYGQSRSGRSGSGRGVPYARTPAEG